MKALRSDVDPQGLREFSVVFTDRSLNHMSAAFQLVMNDISRILKSVYSADHVALIPGGGTYAMESVARQFALGEDVMVLRNGWFSYRWTQIFESGDIPKSSSVMKAARLADEHQSPFAPAAIEDVVAAIKTNKPAVVFAPHVETSSGMILPDDYITAVADAVHSVGGLFVLDCIASGTVWVDMATTGVDVLISAPQKGWSASPSAGLVMMNERAREVAKGRKSNSFALDLNTWSGIMDAYEAGGFGYHATMPTDALAQFRDVMLETEALGFDKLKASQLEMGEKVRAALKSRGVVSVAADGFGAPGVVVSYTDDADIKSGAKFKAQGMQIAAGVPLMCDEPADYSSFRLGLFGLDKLADVDAAVASLETAFDAVL